MTDTYILLMHDAQQRVRATRPEPPVPPPPRPGLAQRLSALRRRVRPVTTVTPPRTTASAADA